MSWFLTAANIAAAAMNFGWWQKDINAGLFVYCSLLAIWLMLDEGGK